MSDTPFCDKVASALALGPGHEFQDRNAWEKTARAMERERNALEALLREIRNTAEINNATYWREKIDAVISTRNAT